ncbi:SDR family oxidoreductase [Ramlibacter solisilvae]|uniref:Short-chain dehydrogenase n=1 Tax=Ramlibacter tataouinensis TaxID=94132 RepID=A0A127JWN7_9BURK|nr:SDR family oxidoreductase [Ramlibacter tataouinensis]AMO24428.1 short-chain dehydrogenase [Ramlibacter tataouinensis]
MNILIVGATSAIAEATARLWAAEGHRIMLLGRRRNRLESIADDLRVRGAGLALCETFDATEFEAHERVVDRSLDALGSIDLVLVAHGSLGNQRACERDFSEAHHEYAVNALSVISLLTHIANRMETQGRGAIAVIGSVAGDRGRQSNYVYGSAKAAVDVFVQGLRNRLHRAGVHVMLVKPGLIDTPMTAGFRKGVLWSAPDAVARSIVRGLARRRNVVYAPSFWRPLMAVIRSIPEPLFKTLSL